MPATQPPPPAAPLLETVSSSREKYVRRLIHSGVGYVGTLLDAGLAAIDPVGLGLRATGDGSLVDVHGDIVPGLFGAGPLLRGTAYEATAVPELRVQAATVARSVAREVRRHDGVCSAVIRVSSRPALSTVRLG